MLGVEELTLLPRIEATVTKFVVLTNGITQVPRALLTRELDFARRFVPDALVISLRQDAGSAPVEGASKEGLHEEQVVPGRADGGFRLLTR